MSSNSFIGLGGYGSTNGSRVYGVSTSLSFLENRWKLAFTAAEIDLNYDLIVFGLGIPLRQTGKLGSAELSYGITPDFSVGFGARYISTSIFPNLNIAIPPEYTPDLSTEIASGGVLLNWDRRDDTFFSREGTNLDLSVYHHDVLSDPRDYQKAVLTLDGYMPVGEKHVAAGRITACKATEDAPFFDACALGVVDSFRGFSFNENIGEELASLQLSWRGTFGQSRFGYEVFAGSGRVYKTFPGAGESRFRSAGGIGLKYRLSKKFPLDLALDVALNDAGEDTTYIYVGQRF
jgi:outer membrane protein assembly factor BamA